MSLFWFQFAPWSPSFLLGIGLGCVLNVLVMAWALRHEHLTRGGAWLALAMGISFWIVAPLFFILLLSFFMTSSMFSKYKRARKAHVQDKYSKSGKRDANQVLANGVVAWVATWVFLLTSISSTPCPFQLAAAFSVAGAIAATNADTWGTEIGVLSKNQPRWILDLRKRVEPGTSGGVSTEGTLACLAGAFCISITCFFLLPLGIPGMPWFEPRYLLPACVCGLGGFASSLIDSILGATIQGFYKCNVCGKETEKRVHCNTPALLVRGRVAVGNDVVNLVAMISGALAGFVAGWML